MFDLRLNQVGILGKRLQQGISGSHALNALVFSMLLFFSGGLFAQSAPISMTCQVTDADGSMDDILMNWINTEVYDLIHIMRNGVMMTTIPGNLSTFTDIGSPAGFHLYTVHGVIGTAIGQGVGCSVQIIPPPLEPPLEPPPPLDTLEVLLPPTLIDYVSDQQAAIRLGKAFFWDMQAGSDGITACGTCHYHAGADARKFGQRNPGADGAFSVNTPLNHMLTNADFPLHELINPENQDSFVVSTTDDTFGSNGQFNTTFIDLIEGSDAEAITLNPDPVFNIPGDGTSLNTRRSTNRQAPTVINAIHHIETFWDGRASFFFNGRNHEGHRDQGVTVLKVQADGSVAPISILMHKASLASQATVPLQSSVEMAAAGRNFPKTGKKLLALQPLGKQVVHPNDSSLSAMVDADGLGLNTTYAQMIMDAFRPEWWSSEKLFEIDPIDAGNHSPHNFVELATTGTPANTDQFTMMEANFSLFWGLAIMMYESTLVADDTPFDRFQAGDLTAMTPQQVQGMDVLSQTNCLLCHASPLFSSAITHKVQTVLEPEHSGLESLVEFMPMKDFFMARYDGGFYNLGVTPISQDIGRAALNSNGDRISLAGYLQDHGEGSIPFPPGTFLANPPIEPWEEVAHDGAFKTPSLRNTELTGPYFHNGGYATLDQVVKFYARGGNFADENIDDLAPTMLPLPFLIGQPGRQAAMVEFIKALTDERVRYEMAPFDHPQIFIAEGLLGTETIVEEAAPGAGFGADRFKEIIATGAAGRLAEGAHPLLAFLQPTAVTDFTCTSDDHTVSLSWTLPEPMPLIRVFREDVLLTTLAGNQVSYTDPVVPAGLNTYSVQGIDSLEGLMATCSVNVTPTEIGGLTIQQIGQDISIGWLNQDSYDSVVIMRDGSPLTTVPGSSDLYLDTTVAPGPHEYSLIAITEGVQSIAVSGTVDLLPLGLVSLDCTETLGEAVLTWVSGDTYTEIEITREGSPLVTLSGDATTYTDVDLPAGVTSYQVTPSTGGVATSTNECGLIRLPHPIAPLLCDNSAGPGELNWTNNDLYSSIDLVRDGVVLAQLAGDVTSFTDAGLPSAGSGSHSYMAQPRTEGIVGAAATCDLFVDPNPIVLFQCQTVAAGVRLTWVNMDIYDSIEILREGTLLVTLAGTELEYTDLNPISGLSSYSIRNVVETVTSTEQSCTAGFPPASITEVLCQSVSSGISVSWTNADNYSEVRVFRNGGLLTTVAGTIQNYVDTDPLGGNNNYWMLPVLSGIEALEVSPTCSAGHPPDPVVALDCTSSDICSNTFTMSWFNSDLYEQIQILVDGVLDSTINGFATSHDVSLAQSGSRTLSVIAFRQGIPSVAVSCTVETFDDSLSQSPSDLSLSVDTSSCLATLSWVSHGPYGSLEIKLGGTTVATLSPTDTQAVVQLPGAGTHSLCVAATSFCQAPLAEACLDAFCPVRFQRGDLTADGNLDIADATGALAVVFGQGSTTCLDAVDANDDGQIDISDPVQLLMHLFLGSGPLPAPHGSCGIDPTADSLNCDSSGSCP